MVGVFGILPGGVLVPEQPRTTLPKKGVDTRTQRYITSLNVHARVPLK